MLSGLGKGVTASSIGVLLKSAGLRVTSIKIDPYLNSDAGTMSPFEHGEVFVLDDGGEVDLDLGNYERFLDLNLARDNNLTTGKIYSKVLEAERRGDYLGKTVQVIPHITDAVQDWIIDVAKRPADGSDETPDVCIIELGGTVGDIESAPYLEALRQFQFRVGRKNVTFFHVSLVPVMGPVGEQKTKPTQHSVKELRSIGIQPDIIICRTERPIPLEHRKKISLFCNVHIKNVIETVDVKTIYEAPISFSKEKLDLQVLNYFNLRSKKVVNLNPWKKITKIILKTKKQINIAIIGKYVELKDAYKSLDEALTHGGIENKVKINLVRIDSEKLKKNEIKFKLKGISGILIPGGFGKRGTDGKIEAIKYARKNNIPFLGICFGMQMAIIEFARNVLNLKKATSSEFNKNGLPVIGLINEWNKDGKVIKGTDKELGGTMRLGSYEAKLKENSMIKKIYGKKMIEERHRHRYEVNINFRDRFEKKGMIFSGLSPDDTLPEIIELKNHPWFIGVQFHPEFKSRPLSPHPLFSSFIKASKNYK